MRRATFSPQARLDMFAIWLHIADDSLDAADRVREQFEAAAALIADTPSIGHRRGDVKDQALRFWKVHSYLMVYREAEYDVEIVRVLSGSRDIGLVL